MPFVPHTTEDIAEMLKTVGVKSTEDLFDEIPAALKKISLDDIPVGISEMALGQEMRLLAQKDEGLTCFIGAGAYQHHIPAAVWEIATRGEFMTAYTPYQPEASQGSLQLIFEFQSMMANLLAMEVSNASLYDGATALVEAILMAARLKSSVKNPAVLIPKSIHPHYLQTIYSMIKQQQIKIIEVPYLISSGQIDFDKLNQLHETTCIALVIPQPNFFGVLEEVDALTAWAQQLNMLTIGLVNPLAQALLKPPGEWGDVGVDLACGEGQPLGIPLASGGPYYGFLCCQKKHVRQMPGRIVGQTEDANGKRGFVLTLQAREQHIRRAKATSNICTNQGLMVTASTIYMSLLGPMGLRKVAEICHLKTRELQEALRSISGVEIVFNSPFFHEFVIRLPCDSDRVLAFLAQHKIQGGCALNEYFPELGNTLLLCATEIKTSADISQFAQQLSVVLCEELA